MRSEREIARRHKTCAYCHVEFCDISKRPDAGRCCCKEHTKALMVQTRRANGSYQVSQEQKTKMVATIRQRYGSFAACQTDAGRKRNSEAFKARWASGEMACKVKETSLAKYGVEHWTQSDEGRAFTSQLHKGRRHSPDVRAKMSASAARRVRTKRETLYTSANGGHRGDLGLYFRSNWEANYARILQHEGKQWEYEPVSFELGEMTYTPDFRIAGKDGFVEIKGRVDDEDAMRKVTTFMRLHPEIPIEFIGPPEYEELRRRYKKLIAWEGK